MDRRLTAAAPRKTTARRAAQIVQTVAWLATTFIAAGCTLTDRAQLEVAAGMGPSPQLPAPSKALVPAIEVAPARGWSDGQAPQPAKGLQVTAFAGDLDHPRWLHVLPNGDVLVAETNAPKERGGLGGFRGWLMGIFQKRAGAGVPSADRITLLRDADGDGRAETRSVFLDKLHSPFGMALVGNDFYVANTSAVLRFPYTPGALKIDAPGVKVVDLPGGEINHHWTKNIIASRDGALLYATVGSNSNHGEKGETAERGRAAIWEIDPKSGRHRVFASGLRNPNGLGWEPTTGALWTAVNERDELGSDLVPDYITAVKDGGFYGWPYSYYGQHVDPRVAPQRPDLVAQALAPDYAVGSHTAPLGFTFDAGSRLPAPYASGAFVGLHGSWNRRPRSGYEVIFVPFANGRPNGMPRTVLSGFLSGDGEALGRPVGVAIDRRGALLVADDVGNRVWRVTSAETAPGTATAR